MCFIESTKNIRWDMLKPFLLELPAYFTFCLQLELVLSFVDSHTLTKEWKHKHLKNVQDVLLLMCFLLISLAFDRPGVVVLLVTVTEDVTTTECYAFWMYSQVGPPFSMLIYPAGFFFYSYSLIKLKMGVNCNQESSSRMENFLWL